MTEHQNDKRDAGLDTLYREAGDVEPDAGLDRIIRARAEQAAHAGRSSSRFPWLGGLITASVAIVAIAVVLQQSPPREPMPGSPAPQAADEAEAFMAPSMGADTDLERSAKTQRTRSEMRETQFDADTAQAAPPPSAAPLNDRGQVTEEQRAARLADMVAEQASNAGEPAPSASEVIAEAPESILARIDELIERNEIQHARELLDAFRREYPGHSVPAGIRDALASSEDP
jgi:hypothetical protein